MNKKIKDIVSGGLYQGYSTSHILLDIVYEIATKEEKELLIYVDYEDLPELENKARILYEKYRKEYYEEGGF